jgi:hypothetical protein
MAALTPVVATNVGATTTGVAVSASDTVAQGVMGTLCLIEVVNAGGSTDNITITDKGTTVAGNQLSGTTVAGSVAAGGSKVFALRNPGNVDPATGLVTITHSFITSVTCKLYSTPVP